QRAPERAVSLGQCRLAVADQDQKAAADHVIEPALASVAAHLGLDERLAGSLRVRAAADYAALRSRHPKCDQRRLPGVNPLLHRSELGIACVGLLRIALDDVLANAHAFDHGVA